MRNPFCRTGFVTLIGIDNVRETKKTLDETPVKETQKYSFYKPKHVIQVLSETFPKSLPRFANIWLLPENWRFVLQKIRLRFYSRFGDAIFKAFLRYIFKPFFGFTLNNLFLSCQCNRCPGGRDAKPMFLCRIKTKVSELGSFGFDLRFS